MRNLTVDEVAAFCNHCDWCFQSWQLVKYLFSENEDEKHFRLPEHRHFFNRLWKILQEYWLHEVAKLGDPAFQGGHSNLSIDYVYKRGNWPEPVSTELGRHRSDLLRFAAKTGAARNKLLSHKDVETITSGITLGEFNEKEDDAYFEQLQKFASLAHEQYVGGPYPFDDLTRNDVEIFSSTFARGVLHGQGQ